MHPFDLMLWSAVLGALGYAATWAVFQALERASKGAWLLVIYFVLLMIWVAGLSGWASRVLPIDPSAALLAAQIAAPLSGLLSVDTLRRFLRVSRHDNTVQWALYAAAACWLVALVAAFWPSAAQALPAQAYAALLAIAILVWACARSALLGDKLAWFMVVSNGFVAIFVFSLYAYAMSEHRNSTLTPGALTTAVAMVLHLVIATDGLTRRARAIMVTRKALRRNPDIDLLTQIATAGGLVRKLDAVMARARKNRKTCALIYVEVFNIAAIKAEHGAYAEDDVIYALAARVREAASPSDVVGRYGNYGFVIAIGSLRNFDVLRSLGLRLARSVRHPYALSDRSTQQRRVNAEIGIGVVTVNASAKGTSSISPLEDDIGEESMQLAQAALHDAELLARAARTFKSNVATHEAPGGPAVPLEQVQAFH
jgi:diguanylate cyclase (GGDEF)-like protein